MVWGLEQKARDLMARGEVARAAEVLRQGIMAESKTNPRYLNLLGICETRLGHRETAKEAFSEALSVSPRNAAALTNLGNLAFLEGDQHAAREFYVRALRENVLLREPRFNLVLSYQDMGHFEKAMTAYEEYVAIAKAAQWSRYALAAGLILLILFLLKR